jgi:hypothetical protein
MNKWRLRCHPKTFGYFWSQKEHKKNTKELYNYWIATLRSRVTREIRKSRLFVHFSYTQNMILFINPISEDINLFVVENGEVRQSSTIPKGKDYDAFPEMVNDIIHRHNIDTIWCVVWPWAFTRMRIVTLTLNTIAMVKNIPLKGCHFFEILNSNNPILRANDREYILLDEMWVPSLSPIESIDPSKTYTGYALKNDFTDEKNFIEYSEDLTWISEVFRKLPPTNRLTPIYLKEPHITWSKKNTFPSSKTTNKS